MSRENTKGTQIPNNKNLNHKPSTTRKILRFHLEGQSNTSSAHYFGQDLVRQQVMVMFWVFLISHGKQDKHSLIVL